MSAPSFTKEVETPDHQNSVLRTENYEVKEAIVVGMKAPQNQRKHKGLNGLNGMDTLNRGYRCTKRSLTSDDKRSQLHHYKPHFAVAEVSYFTITMPPYIINYNNRTET
jgi:hypothetical protein